MLTPDKKEKIVYIVYFGNQIHEVETICLNTGSMTSWDFMVFDNDPKDIRRYESGSGPYRHIIAPKLSNGCKGGSYWIDPSIKLKGRPKNIKNLKRPKPIKGYFLTSVNPFKVSEEVNHYDYCEECNAYMADLCDIHQYWDDVDGFVRYKKDNSVAE